MKPYLPSPRELDVAFTWFEYFYALSLLDLKLPAGEAVQLANDQDSDLLKFWVPVGRFGWNNINLENITAEDLPKALRSGFFGGDSKEGRAKLDAIVTLVNRFGVRASMAWGI